MISCNISCLKIQQTINGRTSTAAVRRQTDAAQRQLLFHVVGDDASACGQARLLYKEIYLCAEFFVRVTDDRNRGNRFLRID